jgi:hypothetical protein
MNFEVFRVVKIYGSLFWVMMLVGLKELSDVLDEPDSCFSERDNMPLQNAGFACTTTCHTKKRVVFFG